MAGLHVFLYQGCEPGETMRRIPEAVTPKKKNSPGHNQNEGSFHSEDGFHFVHGVALPLVIGVLTNSGKQHKTMKSDHENEGDQMCIVWAGRRGCGAGGPPHPIAIWLRARDRDQEHGSAHRFESSAGFCEARVGLVTREQGAECGQGFRGRMPSVGRRQADGRFRLPFFQEPIQPTPKRHCDTLLKKEETRRLLCAFFVPYSRMGPSRHKIKKKEIATAVSPLACVVFVMGFLLWVKLNTEPLWKTEPRRPHALAGTFGPPTQILCNTYSDISWETAAIAIFSMRFRTAMRGDGVVGGIIASIFDFENPPVGVRPQTEACGGRTSARGRDWVPYVG